MEIQLVMPNGLELAAKNELKKMGYAQFQVKDGHIEMECTYEELLRLNMSLRTPDRIFVILKRFPAETFEELFDGVNSFPWEEWIGKDSNFMVQGNSKKSKLFSVRNCQSITEKAIVERLKEEYEIDWFLKSEERVRIHVNLENDLVTLLLDSSGEGLHKRGYRLKTVEAPLRETMAAALLDLTFWKEDRVLYDPFCGSGTFLIEAAMKGLNLFPGYKRKYDCEFWKCTKESTVKKIREELEGQIQWGKTLQIYGSDMDSYAVKATKENIRAMGLEEYIQVEQREFPKQAWELPSHGVMIANPPYGERLEEDQEELLNLYGKIGDWMHIRQTWSFYLLTSFEDLEKAVKRKADRKRKLFNGNIKTDFYQFYGPKMKEKSHE